MLMEMDEVITQLQQWRTKRPDCDYTEPSNTNSGYQSDAYDRIFQKDDPESDCGDVEYTPRSPTEKKYTADAEMVAKVSWLFISVHILCMKVNDL